MPVCVSCGGEVPEGAAFCPKCGAPITPSSPAAPCIKVYRIPKGEAFKALFDFIKENFYDKEFCVEDLPDVNEAFVKEVDQAIHRLATSPHGRARDGRPKTFLWFGPDAKKQAKIEILVEMSKAGLLSYRRESLTTGKVLYKLTEEGRQAEVVFGD